MNQSIVLMFLWGIEFVLAGIVLGSILWCAAKWRRLRLPQLAWFGWTWRTIGISAALALSYHVASGIIYLADYAGHPFPDTSSNGPIIVSRHILFAGTEVLFAFSACRVLIRGQWWQTLLLTLVAIVIIKATQLILAFPFLILALMLAGI